MRRHWDRWRFAQRSRVLIIHGADPTVKLTAGGKLLRVWRQWIRVLDV